MIPIFKFNKNIERIYFFIVFILLNVIIFGYLILNNKSPKYLFIFHFVILFLILVTDLKRAFWYSSNYKYNDYDDYYFNNSIYLKNFTYQMHLFFCYSSFIYLILFLYVIFLIINKKLDKNIIFYVISLGVIGLFFSFKETILQFSQCLYSGFSDYHRDKKNYGNKCDKEYREYWKCIQF